jgi:hypothetical protein
MSFVHETFQKIILETPATNALFYAMSGIACVFMLIEISRIYSAMLLKQRMEPWQIARPFAIMLIAGSWKFIYAGLNLGFTSINQLFESSLAANFKTANNNSVIGQMFSQVANDSTLSLFSLNLNAVLLGLLNFILAFLYWLVDLIVSLYIDINDFVLALFAPIAIVFSVLRETARSFMTWFLLFAKFRLFMLATTVTNFLALSLVTGIKDGLAKALEIPTSLLSVVGVANTITTITLTVFLVFKIIFLLMTWSFLGQIFNAGDLSGGSGAAQIVTTMKTVAAKALTKGAA